MFINTLLAGIFLIQTSEVLELLSEIDNRFSPLAGIFLIQTEEAISEQIGPADFVSVPWRGFF